MITHPITNNKTGQEDCQNGQYYPDRHPLEAVAVLRPLRLVIKKICLAAFFLKGM